MHFSRGLGMVAMLLLGSIPHAQKHPEIFDVSDVVMGAKRLSALTTVESMSCARQSSI
jgi:hypothetical protein